VQSQQTKTLYKWLKVFAIKLLLTLSSEFKYYILQTNSTRVANTHFNSRPQKQ